ncbi:acetyl-CoA carboxylase biotin carboxyl carrier protein [Kitasatospora sp. NPDC048365]|uniref:acetyl-CoA carboxylase biotin carboxyl carrier protein n=1 Tax=Kitasatospora sp. NPDC048365 TaxID=3364050 RepID=UPI0037130994
MTTELTGDPADLTAGPTADLPALCHSIAELARIRPELPARIRLEHLGTAVEIQWKPVTSPAVGVVAEAPAAPAAAEPETASPHQVKAPMIGTFYHAPEPGSPPYVRVGDTVAAGQPIGLLEVMKMMTPVEADAAGTVVEILAPDAAPVEFQQPLIAVRLA